MSEPRTITQCLAALKGGDEAAAQAIWERFFQRACALARKKLGDLPKRMADEEDVALSAMHALCLGAREDRFQRLETRDDLWQLLAMITSRKASNLRRAAGRRPVSGESVFADEEGRALERLITGAPDPEFLAALSGTSEDLIGGLEPKLRAVALLRLEGFTNEEIGARLGRSVASIERYVARIRGLWATHLGA